MKVLVTGVSGQLGHDVMNELDKRGYTGIGSDIADNYSGIQDNSAVTTMEYVKMDITDEAVVDEVISSVSPDVIIHCAAWTAVDMAEDDDKVEKVRAVNAKGTANIAKAAKRLVFLAVRLPRLLTLPIKHIICAYIYHFTIKLLSRLCNISCPFGIDSSYLLNLVIIFCHIYCRPRRTVYMDRLSLRVSLRLLIHFLNIL